MVSLQAVAEQGCTLGPTTIDAEVEKALMFSDRYNLSTNDGLAAYVRQQAVPGVLELRHNSMARQQSMTNAADWLSSMGAVVVHIGVEPNPVEIAEKSMNGVFFYIAVLDLLAYDGNRALAAAHSPVLEQFISGDGTCQPLDFITRVKEGATGQKVDK